MKSEKWCSNPGRSPRIFFWRKTMDYCVNRMLISGIMEIFIMVCPSLPRAISKCVSREQGDYLNYNDLSPTKFPVNI
jgi:hypothetical protein